MLTYAAGGPRQDEKRVSMRSSEAFEEEDEEDEEDEEEEKGVGRSRESPHKFSAQTLSMLARAFVKSDAVPPLLYTN